MARAMPMLAGAAALAACSQAPAYRPPSMPLPSTYHDAQGVWAEAGPAAPASGEGWWMAMGDPALDAMEQRLEWNNPDLAAALARHRLALAALDESRGSTLPDVAIGGAVTRNRQSDRRPLRGSGQPDIYNADTLGATAGYELDLWGRVGDAVKGAKANAEASAFDAAAVRLALQADLASTWAAMRGADLDIAILSDAVAAYRRAETVTRHRFEGGIANGIDLGRAQAQLADAEAQLLEARATRLRLEHAITALAGLPAGTVEIAALGTMPRPIPVAASLPSTLLQRRPDIAAAERRMFAANRAIGIARAARFPVLSLGGSGGFQSTAVAGLLAAPNLFWALGPQIALPVFDGGRRHARILAARAEWDIATDKYRASVLLAMREVQDDLSSLAQLQQEQAAQTRASQAAAEASRLSYERYIKGANTLLDVVTAEASELAARRQAARIATQRVTLSIALVRATGGGWTS